MWLLEVNMGHLRSKLQLSVCMRDKRGCYSIKEKEHPVGRCSRSLFISYHIYLYIQITKVKLFITFCV